mmetsp:Transcript_135003/g.349822  ORF Transcript_135003/g.349822 Transcript_135003/m.349822 type:complete len:325 (-) Transcript_135003:44-1018(-)
MLPAQMLGVRRKGLDPARLDLAGHLHALGTDHRAGAQASVDRLVRAHRVDQASTDHLVALPGHVEHDDLSTLPNDDVSGVDVLCAPLVQGLAVLVVQRVRDLSELVRAALAGGGAARQRRAAGLPCTDHWRIPLEGVVGVLRQLQGSEVGPLVGRVEALHVRRRRRVVRLTAGPVEEPGLLEELDHLDVLRRHAHEVLQGLVPEQPRARTSAHVAVLPDLAGAGAALDHHLCGPVVGGVVDVEHLETSDLCRVLVHQEGAGHKGNAVLRGEDAAAVQDDLDEAHPLRLRDEASRGEVHRRARRHRLEMFEGLSVILIHRRRPSA